MGVVRVIKQQETKIKIIKKNNLQCDLRFIQLFGPQEVHDILRDRIVLLI